MAHFAITIHSDPNFRQQHLRAAQRMMQTVPSWKVQQAEVGEFGLTWALGPTAPHSFVRSPDGCALLLGYAINDAGEHVDAAMLLNAWSLGKELSAHDGYFAAIAYHCRRGLAILCDPLGYFPVYHNRGKQELAAGSSPALCGRHPSSDRRLNMEALAGVLLTNGLVRNRPLNANLTRLAAGRHLEWTSANGCRERSVFTWEPDETVSKLSPSEADARADAEFCAAIRRHQPQNAPANLFLSGGLDSRLMATYLKSLDIPCEPVVWGRKTDFEVQAAQRVALALQLPISRESREASPDCYVQAARQKVAWEQLSGGVGNLDPWLEVADAKPAGQFCWHGYCLEETLGGRAMQNGFNSETNSWSFENYLMRLNRWGLPSATLGKLLRPCGRPELVPQLIADMKHDYDQSAWSVPQQSLSAYLSSTTRFHIGAVLHRLSFRSWPLLPMFDRRILQLIFSLPPETMLDRRLEMKLLCQRAPLATKIPFDTNSFFFSGAQAKQSPHRGTLWQRTLDKLASRSRRWYWQAWKREEPRRYFRLYDFNSPGWRAIRAAAEPLRASIFENCDRATLNELLPSPQTTIRLKAPFAQGATRRALLGLMLCQAASAV